MPSEEQTYRANVVEKLVSIENKIDIVDRKATFTNGKVRKIIIALVLLAGIVIGQTLSLKEIVSGFIQRSI